ncbi:MAG: RdgB/HAM1 family non-canonical purine NTP pyrophosphatase [Chitinophagaceae bacterium]
MKLTPPQPYSKLKNSPYLVAMKLIFATNNQHKVEEIRHIIGSTFDLLTLKDAGINIDIPEPHDTLEENASEKSKIIYQLTNTSCFSEDTGLEVTALDGEPGVKSARYAGGDKTFDKNIDKLLDKLKDKPNTAARFRTVISLIIDGGEHLFDGTCNGKIIRERRGIQGFGYDPVFIPDGSDKTFAEMTLEEKSRFSHRKKATGKLVAFLNTLEPKY